MAATVLETLSPEDLERWRLVCATLEMAKASPPTLTLTDEEVRRAILDEYVLVAELFEKYRIEPDEAVEAKISVYTGAIFIGTGE